MVKRIVLSFLLAAILQTAFAQINGSGYYRVMNQKSSRYAYICDNTGSLDYTNQSADMGAIQLWRDCSTVNHLTDPSGVVYYKLVEQSSVALQRGDLIAQGTSVYSIISHYVMIDGTAKSNRYQVFASESGLTLYLADATTTTRKDQGQLETTGKVNEYTQWNVFPINQTDNYVAVAPAISAGGKHYAPYYVSFPFSFYSSGMKAYYISKVDKKRALAVMKEITGTIPAAVPVIIECSSTDAANNKLALTTGTFNAPTGNCLKGVYFSNPNRAKSKNAKTQYDVTTMRVLGLTADGNLGYITATNDMLNLCNGMYCLQANQSYLSVPTGTPAELTIISEKDYNEILAGVEGVEADAPEVETYYSLSGAQLQAPAKGINIVKYTDGTVRKVFIR